MRDFNGKIAVVTGAGSGFGRALVLQLAARGAIPVLADKNATAMAETIGLLGKPESTVMAEQIDVRDAAAMTDFAARVHARFGQVDLLVNNAGMISRAESFLEVDQDHAKLIFDVNFWGVNNGCRAFVPYLALREEAALVNVASSLGVFVCPLHSAYCASKAAVVSYSEVLRQELKGSRISLTVVLPGAAKTNLGRNIPIEDEAKRQRAIANFERFATTKPEHVAARIINAVGKKRRRVGTGIDGVALVFMARHFPDLANGVMNYAYRRTADPEQFALLTSYKQPAAG